MDIFSVLTLLGGLAFFLYGMKAMSSGLEKIAGGSLEKIIRRMTSNIWSGLFLGIGITALIQSSSAVTVILVGLVNSGIMVLNQTTAVIMGSNIGTTATAWLLSLTGIQSNNGIIKFPETVLFTSHDHQFVQTIATRIIDITTGSFYDKEMTYDEYLEEMAEKKQE